MYSAEVASRLLTDRGRVLDAPNLRDDFYCSILAYSPSCHTLAVGLGDHLYSWSEATGVKLINPGHNDGTWLTSLSFSSVDGGKSILAYGRSNNMLTLASMYEDSVPRVIRYESSAVACVSWRPCSTLRPSRNPNTPGTLVKTEDLLVGDETGHVSYYVVEWPDRWEVDRDNWEGELTLMARISVHHQQICGIAWSNDGKLFATGGNDNLCCLFEVDKVLDMASGPQGLIVREPLPPPVPLPPRHPLAPYGMVNRHVTGGIARGFQSRQPPIPTLQAHTLGRGIETCRWEHRAAVKAIAFCPWQDGLLATGGGSNDKCIHFYHTGTGAALATISVCAQVTSLIWSPSRREIAATFGYAQPEHPYRIGVFSWPGCNQVAAIPWEGKHRALYAIPYPRSVICGSRCPVRPPKAPHDGCIIVATSDECIKFHEVWPADEKTPTSGVGMLGGSDILEDLAGIDKEGDVIR